MDIENKMLSHYCYATQYIGYSDIASLIFRSPMKCQEIAMGGDGVYNAYIVNDRCTIPDSYKLVYEADHWLKIYDDERCTFHFYGDKIRVFRRGDFGTIIQIINKNMRDEE